MIGSMRSWQAQVVRRLQPRGPLTESVLVGALADRCAGQWLQWDHNSQTFTNSVQATQLVRRTYRDGWTVDGLG